MLVSTDLGYDDALAGLEYDALGATRAELETIADNLAGTGFLMKSEIQSAMAILSQDDRQTLAELLLARGVDSSKVQTALQSLAPAGEEEYFGYSKRGWRIYAAVSTVSMALSAYHGYRRNSSIGWAIAWGALGSLFPVITPTIAVAQGFGKPK